jgi:hypothetical protein
LLGAVDRGSMIEDAFVYEGNQIGPRTTILITYRNGLLVAKGYNKESPWNLVKRKLSAIAGY